MPVDLAAAEAAQRPAVGAEQVGDVGDLRPVAAGPVVTHDPVGLAEARREGNQLLFRQEPAAEDHQTVVVERLAQCLDRRLVEPLLQREAFDLGRETALDVTNMPFHATSPPRSGYRRSSHIVSMAVGREASVDDMPIEIGRRRCRPGKPITSCCTRW